MRKVTCEQLDGDYTQSYSAKTFQEIAELSKVHRKKMYHTKDAPNLEAMNKMVELMKSPDKIKKWFIEKEVYFNSLVQDEC